MKHNKFKKTEDFVQDSTREGITILPSSPGFGDYLIERADRVKLLPAESYDEKLGGDFDSTENNPRHIFLGRYCKTPRLQHLQNITAYADRAWIKPLSNSLGLGVIINFCTITVYPIYSSLCFLTM